MVALNECTNTNSAGFFTYRHANCIANSVSDGPNRGKILINLSGVSKTDTAALARLVVLRRELRRNGRDLVICGIAGKARALYEIQRFDELLPLCQCA